MMYGLNFQATQNNEPDTRHLLYQKHLSQINLVNNVYNGTDSMKEYLFRFPQELQDTYLERYDRATLRNFVRRAIEAFTGMIFRKPLEVEGYGPRVTRSFPTIDTRQDIKQFSKDLTESVTKDGKTYVLIDSPRDASSPPYLIHINRLQLINWRRDLSGKFTMIVIEEILSVPYGDFGTKYIEQWRHYDIDGTVSIYQREVDNSLTIKLIERIETDYDGIPIVEIAVDDIPMLYDTARLNIKHYNRLSHKDRYLTMAALPIPVIWGADLDDDGNTTTAKPALVIGVDEAFIFSGTKDESDFQWRELSGNSIDLLEKDLNSITEDITTGILRAADSSNTVQKTATEIALLMAEASDRVSAIAISVQLGMVKALEILSEFNNEKVPSTAMFKLSTDFNAALAGTDGQRLVFESYMQGLVSIETYLQSLSDAELIKLDSSTKELERIEKDKFVPVPKTGSSDIKMDNRTKSAITTEE